MNKNNKSYLLLQLHITGRCNQKCKHCYHTEYTNEPLSFKDIEKIIEDYLELLKKYNEINKIEGFNKIGHINVTGGEPFIRKDFMDILELLYEKRDYFTFGILTNGSYITDEIAKKLVKLQVAHVQVSIDGGPKVHDFIRGNGNFERTFNAIDILRKYKIRTIVSFTASKINYKEFPIVAEYCKKHDVSTLWSDRLVPIGNGVNIGEQCLSSKECLEYFKIMKNEQDKALKDENCKTEIYMKRALQFIASKGTIYTCKAADSAFTIDEFGNILPCRRMPIKCGNILKDNLSDIYFNNEIMKQIRKKEIPRECEKCRFRNLCNGGARCISYAINKDFNKADPYCPLIFYKRNNN